MNRKSSLIVAAIIAGVAPLATFGGLVQLSGTTPQNISSTSASCTSTFTYAFYEGQSFRSYDTQTPNTLGSSWEMLDSTKVQMYNPYNALGNTINGNSLGGLLPYFTYRSNGRPGTTHFNFGGIATIMTYKQVDPTYTVKPSPNPNRTSYAAQIAHNLHRRQIQSWGSTTNIYTMTYVNTNSVGSSFSSNPSAFYNEVSDFECQNFYIAKCGDGVRDNPSKPGTANTDGKNGMLIGGSILPRSSTAPAEECDGTDGVTGPGYACDASCHIVLQPKCTLSPATQTIVAGQNATLNYSSAGAISISNLVNIPGGIILPNIPGSFVVHPTTNTSYSFTVNGAPGTTPAVCTATINVQPITQPTCSLTPSQTIMVGQQATLNFNSTFTNTITNLINISGGIINPNQAGFFVVSPTTTTSYSYTVNGMAGSTPQTCTAVITVQPRPQPTCSLSPSQTIVSGQQATLNFNSTFTNTITNLVNISGGIINPNQAGFFVVSPTTTTSYSFTAIGGYGTTPAVCTATISLVEPFLTIHKTLINNVYYQSGDLVGWRIDFKNTGLATAHHVILTDYLPVSLSYVSSQIVGVTAPYFATGMFGPNISVIYSGFDLAPGQAGYILLTGRLMGYDHCDQTINNSYIESDEIQPPILSNAQFNCATPDTNLTILKTANGTVFHPGEIVNFTVTVTNNGPYVASSIIIGDIRPANNACLIPDGFASVTPMTQTSNTSPYERSLTNTLPVGQTVTLFLSGHIANSQSCAASYTNIATLKYVVNNQIRTGQSQVSLSVPPLALCKKMTAEDGNIILAELNDNNNNYEGEASFSCQSMSGVVASTIAIDCGNGEIHTGYNVTSYDATCHYSESDVPADREATCHVDGNTRDECTQDMIIDKGFFGICGDGVMEDWEDCDLGTNNATIHDYLDEEEQVDADEYANDGYICHNCDIQKGGQGEPMAACFSINNNSISVQEDEILPFWRKIDGETNTTTSCNNSNSANKIVKGTLMCEFRLFNGVHQESEDDEITTITKPCNIDEWTTNHSFGDPLPIFDYFYNQRDIIRSLQNPFGRYYITMQDNLLDDNGHDSTKTYGEYNLALYSVSYDYCDANGDQQTGTPLDRVCEVDFTVTKPYLAQKSSFGLTPKATTINLDGYTDIFGTDIIKDTDLDQIMVLNANNYNGGTVIKAMMSGFINKYEKLAIYYTTKTYGGTTVSISKVPSQNIFVFKGQGGTIILDENDAMSELTTPFTMIVDGVNLVVKGSLTNTNGMFLVKNGMITFEEPAGINKCATDQTVQGIFVTDVGFGSSANLANTDKNVARCANGGLHVKGVLIGDGIDSLVQSRRAHLNHRFAAGSSNDDYVKAERRNEIFNGASVLIEYSPSLRSNLPPGAGEFTQALDVYKK